MAICDRKLCTAFVQIVDVERAWNRLIRGPCHDRMHATPRAAGDDAGQMASRLFGKRSGKSGDDHKMIWFRDLARSGVVVFDRFKFTAKICLKDTLHVFGHFLKTVANLCRIGPDTVTDQEFVEVCKVHQSGKALSQSHWIDERKLNSPRHDAGQQPQQNRTHKFQSWFATRRIVFNRNRCVAGKIQNGWQFKAEVRSWFSTIALRRCG